MSHNSWASFTLSCQSVLYMTSSRKPLQHQSLVPMVVSNKSGLWLSLLRIKLVALLLCCIFKPFFFLDKIRHKMVIMVYLWCLAPINQCKQFISQDINCTVTVGYLIWEICGKANCRLVRPTGGSVLT